MITPTISEDRGVIVFDFGGGISFEARHVRRHAVKGVIAELRVSDAGCEDTTVGRAWLALDDQAQRTRLLADLRSRDGKVPNWGDMLLLVADHLAQRADEAQAPAKGIRASEVKRRPVRWLWRSRIPAGRVSILAGDPDVGKSMITCKLAADISSGATWPDEGLAPRGRVAMVTAEDDLADTVAPRLAQHGADLDRILLIGPQDCGGYILPDGLVPLEERIGELQDSPGDPVLVVLDPLDVFVGRVDTHKAAEVRGAMAPLEALAQRTGATIIGILHLNKRSTETTALYRVGASLAFVAAARSVVVCGYDPEDHAELQHERRRIFTNLKGNLGPKRKALVYRIEDPGVVKWEGESDCSVSDLLTAGAQTKKGGTAVDEAKQFLGSLLSYGPMPANDILEQAKAAGISAATLRRAKQDMGVRAFRRGEEGQRGAGEWLWELGCDHWPEGEIDQRWAFCKERGAEVAECSCCHGPQPSPPDEWDGLCDVCRDGAPHQVNGTARMKARL
ncbi:MAG: hypothetical protein A2Z17_04395 [Gammaproteobacteria bacterium RBG_16_66_13]|nr:MAG: hypothetical protein A2Z17_04395 [Gammaproteobacteria bacterium RBG_16_66_13]